MVRVNNNFDFKVYRWETVPDIIKRLAARMNTLPQYLFLVTPSQTSIKDLLLSESNIDIGDMLQDLINTPIKDFNKFLVEKNSMIDGKPINIIKYIIEPFISFNEKIKYLTSKNPNEVSSILYLINKNLNTYKNVNVESIWSKKASIKKRIGDEIKNNKEDVVEITKLINIEPKPYTPFQREAVSLQLEWDFANLTILEVFDLIVLSPTIPFACLNNLYKILRDSSPDPNWESIDGIIHFKMLIDNTETYISILMEITGDPGHEIANMYTDPLPYRKGLNETKFLQNFHDIFPSISLKQKSSKIVKEKGRFYYSLGVGNKPLDRYIMSDLVMNDPLFNRYLSFDESSKASKGKRWSFYMHFFDENNKSIVKANITMYRVREKDEVHKKYNYPIATKQDDHLYLSVLISDVSNSQNIANFTTIFGKLLQMYYLKAPELILYYQKLLGVKNFPEEYSERASIIPGKKIGLTLSQQAPLLFVKNYPTKCNHAPRIISEEESEIVKSNGYDVMKYPKTADEGIPQRWFVCDSLKKYPYPGLKKNDLSNRDIIPYLPCCLQTKQDNGIGKSSATYDHYFYDQPIPEIVGRNQQNLISRPIFINPPMSGGTLPVDLSEMLNLINQDERVFLRVGVHDSTSSFLQCVIESLFENGVQGLNNLLIVETKITLEIRKKIKLIETNNLTDKKPVNKKNLESWKDRKNERDRQMKVENSKLMVERMNERVKKINMLRQTFATEEMAESCKQEMYNYTTEEIISIIKDTDSYFDPRHFVNMIERKYNCNIIILSRVKRNIVGKPRSSLITTMSLPEHTQSYYKMKRDAVTIVLYEHMGGSTDHQTYPRCEIVALWDTEKDRVHYSYPKGSSVSENLGKIYEKLRKSYFLNCPVNLTTLSKDFLINKGIIPLTQDIDSYGKCRAITFKYEDFTGTFLTAPIQPMILSHGDGTVSRLPLYIVEKLLGILNVKPIKETSSDNQLDAYTIRIGDVNVSIPFTGSDTDELAPTGKTVEEDLKMTETKDSTLITYIKEKRIARYLTDYIRWYYSSFLFSDGNNIHSETTLLKFINDKIVIDENFEYGNISKNFTVNGGLSKDGKLCVKSEETLKRLVYTLQLFISQYPNEFEKYRSLVSISNYYLGIGDFTKHRSQVILQGNDAIIKWIIERRKDYSIYPGILPDKTEIPYFVKNKLMENDNIFLVQEGKNLSSALDISNIWITKGINDVNTINENEYSESDTDEEYNIYSYRNTSDIKEYYCDKGCIEGVNIQNKKRIIGYKDEDQESHFLSVLSFGKCD